MADFKKLSWMQSRLKPTPRMTYEDIDPDSGWTDGPGSRSHLLLLNLPGFKKADIKLQVDDAGTIAVSGGRRVAENKRVQFHKSFMAPEDSDIKRISTEFRGDTFEINIPKIVKKRKEEPATKNAASSSQVREEKNEGFQSSEPLNEEQEQKNRHQREGSESPKEAEENKEEPVIKNRASGSEKVEKESSKDGKEMKEEHEPKNGALSSAEAEEKKEEYESSGETRDMKENQEVMNGSLSDELREEKRENFASSEDAKEKKEESDVKNGTMRNDMGYESEASKEAKETEEKPGLEGASSKRREEYESSKGTNESEDNTEYQNGTPSNDISDEKKKNLESKEEPDTQNRATSSEMVQEDKRDESGNFKEENIGKPDHNVNESKSCHLVKAKGDSSHGNNSEKSMMEKIVENRGILLASIISFTLGVLMSQKFHKPPSK